MKRPEFIKSIEDTYVSAVKILKKKNQDYATGDDPFQNFKLASLVDVAPDRAILVRISDKIARVSNLLGREEGPAVLDEKIEDTIEDAINYLAILKAYLEDQSSKEKTP